MTEPSPKVSSGPPVSRTVRLVEALVAEVQLLRTCKQLVRGECLVEVEEEVVPPLQQQRRDRERVELRARRAHTLRAPDRGGHGAAEQILASLGELGVPAGRGDGLCEPRDLARL